MRALRESSGLRARLRSPELRTQEFLTMPSNLPEGVERSVGSLVCGVRLQLERSAG